MDLGVIEKTELFTNLKQKELDFAVSRSSVLNLPKKGALFSSGEKASSFYLLKSGKIRVFFKSHDGREEEIAHYESGDTIGDFDFARGANYNAYAEASEDSLLIMFPGTGLTMDSLAAEEPDTVCSILFNAIVMMTGRIKAANRLILDKMSWVQDLHRKAYEDAGTGLWKQSLIADEIIGAMKDPAALIMLKPDRFKILVDSRGHSVGDNSMLRIAVVIKNIARRLKSGWPMRFKSNEVGIIINNCDTAQAETIARQLADNIAGLEPVPAQAEYAAFHFTATISWCVWPTDGADWNTLFQGNYANLLDTWKTNGGTINHFNSRESYE